MKDLKGEIKRLIRDRGFGFIRGEDGNEVFFHRSALEGVEYDALEEGRKVDFSIEKGPKGIRAANMRLDES
ncbi:MAG: cold shock domain-containing protein [Candidatus Coatesbacteria bacterium]|nr:cold shock domain-containing protein [Candidatus Coatesbacteria bacterium]